MNKIVILILFVSMNAAVYAQGNRQDMNERIEAQKVAFITQKLELNSSESQAFWPIYNEYQNELKVLRQKNKLNRRTDLLDMSNEEANEMYYQLLDSEYEKLELKKKYSTQLIDVVGPKRVLMLIKLEDDFKREILQRVKERMNGGRSNNGRMGR